MFGVTTRKLGLSAPLALPGLSPSLPQNLDEINLPLEVPTSLEAQLWDEVVSTFTPTLDVNPADFEEHSADEEEVIVDPVSANSKPNAKNKKQRKKDHSTKSTVSKEQTEVKEVLIKAEPKSQIQKVQPKPQSVVRKQVHKQVVYAPKQQPAKKPEPQNQNQTHKQISQIKSNTIQNHTQRPVANALNQARSSKSIHNEAKANSGNDVQTITLSKTALRALLVKNNEMLSQDVLK